MWEDWLLLGQTPKRNYIKICGRKCTKVEQEQELFYLVSERILPKEVKRVVDAKALLENGKVKSITEAVKVVGIGRSTYYKYKDCIYMYDEYEVVGEREEMFEVSGSIDPKPFSELIKNAEQNWTGSD